MTPTGLKIIELFIESLNSKHPNTNKRVITEKDAGILLKCYDFENNIYPYFQEIALEYSITRERIRQLHNRSLRRLGGAGRNLNNADIHCVRLLSLLIKSVDSEQEHDKFKKLISFWKNNLPDIPGEIMVRLISYLIYPNKEDITKNILVFKLWKKEQIEDEKREYIRKQKEKRQKEQI